MCDSVLTSFNFWEKKLNGPWAAAVKTLTAVTHGCSTLKDFFFPPIYVLPRATRFAFLFLFFSCFVLSLKYCGAPQSRYTSHFENPWSTLLTLWVKCPWRSPQMGSSPLNYMNYTSFEFQSTLTNLHLKERMLIFFLSHLPGPKTDFIYKLCLTVPQCESQDKLPLSPWTRSEWSGSWAHCQYLWSY